MTINPDTIADADIDNLSAGAFDPVYDFTWQISDDGLSGWHDIGSAADYTLSESDANKYFRSIVGYTQEDGVITESLTSDTFQFTEYQLSDIPDIETFDDDLHGWAYLSGASVARENKGSLNDYLGHLDFEDQIKKTFNLQGQAYKVGLDFLKFNSWDTKYHHVPDGDTFSVLIDDQVLFTYRPNGNEYVSQPGEAAGYSWTMERSTNGLSHSGVRYAIDIDFPNPLTDFDLQVNLDIDQRYTDEWGGIDNVRIYQEIPISGPAAAPVFSSLETATTVEKGGEGNIVYQAVADDQSPFTYSLEGADPNLFSIDSNTGAVQLLEEANFDTRQNYDFTVRATDVFGNYSDRSVNLGVEDSSLSFWTDGDYRVDAAALRDASPSANALDLKDRYSRALSDEISRSWDGVSVIKSNDGYRMLQVAERGRRRGQYRIAELNDDGVLQSVGAWVDQDQAVADRYQELFELDLNNDGHIGLPAAVDVDLDGFADGLGHYRLMGNGKAVDLSDDRGSTLSSRTSRNWNAVVSKQVGDGFQVVIQGERGRRRSQYQVWSTDANGTVIDKTSWLDGAGLASQGYEQTFNRDFNNDSFAGAPVISSSSDANADGFVDGLAHYMLMGPSPSSTVDLIDNRGRRLTSQSSRSWNAISAAPNPDDPSSGFEVLIQGERGRRRSQYQVWSTDANGQVITKSSWLDRKALAQQGYETTFSKDFDGDALIGMPSGPSLADQDSNGLVDDITHYALLQGSGNTAQAIDLKDSRGNVLSDSSSRIWNVIQAAENGNGFDVLLQGERGRRQSQYLVWKADPTGLITEKSHWLTAEQLSVDGYETVFGIDFNGNGIVAI